MQPKMFVVKRGGRKEPVMFDKITSRVQKLVNDLNLESTDPPAVTLRVINWLYKSGKTSGVRTVDLDNKAAEIAMFMSRKHPEYAVLAAGIAVSNLHKETKEKFSDVVEDLYSFKNAHGVHVPLVSEQFYKFVQDNSERLNSAIVYDRDFSLDCFGFKNLEKKCLKKINDIVVERPQHMFMRVAVAINNGDIDGTIETYNLLSERLFMPYRTTLKTAGRLNFLSSSYSLTLCDDSIDGIYDTVTNCALIFKESGNVGLDIHCLRSLGSYIAGTNGLSNGLLPMLRVFEVFATHSIEKEKELNNLAVHLEPWHFDIETFLSLKNPTGKTEQRAPKLHYVIWIPDLFMKRVLQEDGEWSLMCPHDVSYSLLNCYGKEFEELYTKYEAEGRAQKKVKARDLWFSILESQIKTGGPSILFKDTCNRKSNQQHLGTLKGASFYADSIPYAAPNESPASMSAVIAIHKFVNSDKSFDFDKLKQTAKILTRNLDKMIDNSQYPIESSKVATKRHRPISIGIAGLADAFISMRYDYGSPESKLLNKQISETIYYGALQASCELAKEFGPHESYEGSPVSKGILQFDMWDITPSDLHDWDSLKKQISEHGVRNSLLVAGTSAKFPSGVLGCTEGVEPISCISSGKVSLAEFGVINPHLLRDLMEADLWNEDVENQIIEQNGSIQDIKEIPVELKNLYKTAWEIPQKTVLEMAIDRAPFIDQSQCMNIHFNESNYQRLVGKLNSLHVKAWEKGLKSSLHQLYTAKNLASHRKLSMNGIYNEVMKDLDDLHLTKDSLISGNASTEVIEQEEPSQ